MNVETLARNQKPHQRERRQSPRPEPRPRGRAWRLLIDSSINEARAGLEGRLGQGTKLRDTAGGRAKIERALRLYSEWCIARGLPGPLERR
jgi:hypothetical protein